MYTVKTGEFKGHKTISIYKDEQFVVGFGKSKAKAIVESIEEIKKFLETIESEKQEQL
jgi:uncharacterized protein (DUF169 family)